MASGATPFDLRGRVAVVTGGNGGIGLGMARGLANAGALVAVAARNKEKSSSATRELRALGTEAIALDVDVADEASVSAMVGETVAHWGRLDILVNNAGINIRKPADELSLDEWRKVLDTNLTSAFLCARAAYPEMKRAGGGKIVNVGAFTAQKGAAQMGAYVAAKSAVVRLTETMAAELRDRNINVNCVLPTTIDTPENRAAMPKADPSRWVAPADLANVIVFLASDEARAIHGAALPVTGLS